jgi:bifunctional polynucleotide phosphatase/kinase
MPQTTQVKFIPSFAFDNFKANYEPPQQNEGFSEIKTVNWVFEGNDEERSRWSMWLHLEANNRY